MNCYIMMGTTLAGKSEHGKRLAAEYGKVYVSSGDIARSLMDDATKAEFAEGKLSPHDLEIRKAIFRKMWEAYHSGKDIVLDGFPRTPWHVVHFLAQVFPQQMIVIELDTARDVVIARACKRSRDEFDTEAIVTKRNEVYVKETAPALRFLCEHFGRSIYVPVLFEQEPTTVFAKIVTELASRDLL